LGVHPGNPGHGETIDRFVTADGSLKGCASRAAGVEFRNGRKDAEVMLHLIELMTTLFVICGAATLVLVFALLTYSILVPDSDFSNRKTSVLIFRLLILSALAALGFWLTASILIILFEK
jgi:hypothetical protein